MVSNDRFLAGSSTGVLRLVDADSFEVVASLELPPHTSTMLAALTDGSAVVGAGADGVVRVEVSGQATMSPTWQRLDYGQSCTAMTLVEQADTFYCANGFGRLDELDLETGLVRRSLDAQNGGAGWLWPACDGTELVAFGNAESVVSRWRLDGSGPITRTVASDWSVGSYNADGSMLLVRHTFVPGIEQTDLDFTSKVIDATTGHDVAAVDGLMGPVWVDVDTLGGLVMTDAGLQIALYELTSHELNVVGALLPGPPHSVDATVGKARVLLSFVDDETAEGDLVQVGTDGQLVDATIHIEDYVWMAVSRTGHRVALGTSTGVTVYDGVTGGRIGRIEGELLRGATITVADQLFVSSLGGELVQYDLDTLEPIRTFGGSRGFIQEVYGTTDGSVVAVRGGDRFVSVYDVASGVQIGTPITIPDTQRVYTSLTLDGTQLAIGGGGGDSITIWDLEPGHWVEAACRLAGRNLTPDEWDSNIGDLARYRETCPSS